MKYTICLILLLLASNVSAQVTKDKDSQNVRQKIAYYSLKYNVDPDEIYLTLDCESNHFESPDIQSRVYYKGKRERSFGYAQINLRWHPDVSYAQAIDPDFAINFITKNWTKHKSWWSCYDIMINRGLIVEY